MSVFFTVEPRSTDTRVYAEQFRLSRRKVHIFSLKMNPLNTVAGDGQNVDIFHLTCVVNPAFSVAFLAGKIKQLVLVKVSALVFVSIKQYVREIF